MSDIIIIVITLNFMVESLYMVSPMFSLMIAHVILFSLCAVLSTACLAMS